MTGRANTNGLLLVMVFDDGGGLGGDRGLRVGHGGGELLVGEAWTRTKSLRVMSPTIYH